MENSYVTIEDIKKYWWGEDYDNFETQDDIYDENGFLKPQYDIPIIWSDTTLNDEFEPLKYDSETGTVSLVFDTVPEEEDNSIPTAKRSSVPFKETLNIF